MATAEELEARIREQYPSYTYLLDQPELRQLLLDAVNPDIGFSPEEFQARFQATDWYRTHSDSQRQWEALIGSDRASADRQVVDRMAELRDQMRELGFGEVTHQELVQLADFSLRYGVAPGSAQMRDVLAQRLPMYGEGDVQGGSFTEALNTIKQMANQEYLVGISDADAWRWARQVAAGDATLEGMKELFADVARGKFQHLSGLIDQGIAPGQYFAPYRQMVAQEMDLGSEAVDLMDPKWAEMLSKADGDKVRPMTLGEAQRFVRGKDEWRSTTTAQQMGSSMANELLRTFGAIA